MHPIYPTPAEGSPESADPHFVARVRKCGMGCGDTFTTTARYRYCCKKCRGRLKGMKEDLQNSRVNLVRPRIYRPRDWSEV